MMRHTNELPFCSLTDVASLETDRHRRATWVTDARNHGRRPFRSVSAGTPAARGTQRRPLRTPAPAPCPSAETAHTAPGTPRTDPASPFSSKEPSHRLEPTDMSRKVAGDWLRKHWFQWCEAPIYDMDSFRFKCDSSGGIGISGSCLLPFTRFELASTAFS